MTLCDVIFIAGGEHTSRLPHFSESIVLKHFEAAIGRGCAHGIGDLSFKCNVSKFLCFFVGFLAGKGWRGEWKALCLSFSGQTVSEPGQTYRQFQKFLLVIDSFGPNRCRKYVLNSLRILGQRKYTLYNKQFWEKEKSFPNQVPNFNLFCCLGSPVRPTFIDRVHHAQLRCCCYFRLGLVVWMWRGMAGRQSVPGLDGVKDVQYLKIMMVR